MASPGHVNMWLARKLSENEQSDWLGRLRSYIQPLRKTPGKCPAFSACLKSSLCKPVHNSHYPPTSTLLNLNLQSHPQFLRHFFMNIFWFRPPLWFSMSSLALLLQYEHLTLLFVCNMLSPLLFFLTINPAFLWSFFISWIQHLSPPSLTVYF